MSNSMAGGGGGPNHYSVQVYLIEVLPGDKTEVNDLTIQFCLIVKIYFHPSFSFFANVSLLLFELTLGLL